MTSPRAAPTVEGDWSGAGYPPPYPEFGRPVQGYIGRQLTTRRHRPGLTDPGAGVGAPPGATVAGPLASVTAGASITAGPAVAPPLAANVTGLGWGWPLLGFVGVLGMALTGAKAGGDPAGSALFAFSVPSAAGGHLATVAAFYVGMVMLTVAWMGLGARLWRRPAPDRLTVRALWGVAALWGIPLLVGPTLFSHDIYSYAAQGSLAHAGLSPYSYGPFVLSALGQEHLVSAVAPIWQATTAPYGPLFIALAAAVVAGAGTAHLVAAVLGLRLLDVVGLALMAWALPRLATRLGADPVRALWLGLASPVVLLSFVAAGHNDALMVGLLVAGVTLAVEDHPLLGVLVCALAATVKIPALAGVAFIGLVWARQQAGRRRQLLFLVISALSAVLVLVSLTLIAGLGWGWLSASTLSTPGEVQIALTPTTAVGVTLATILRLLGIGLGNSTAVGVLRILGGLFAAGVGVVLLLRSRRDNFVLALALTLVVVVVAGPVIWPWYLTWGLVLLAACRVGQRSRFMVVICAGFGFLVSPTGGALLSGGLALPTAAAMLTVLAIWWSYRRGWLQPGATLTTLSASWPFAHIMLTPSSHDDADPPPQGQ